MNTYLVETPRHGTQRVEAETLAEARRLAFQLFHHDGDVTKVQS